MASTSTWEAISGGQEKGTRRKKLAGMLSKANELRQSYTKALSEGLGTGSGDDDRGIPESFPDVAIASSEDGQMILFPSYARRHTKRKGHSQDLVGSVDDPHTLDTPGDQEYWRREWEKYEDDNAVVDVDVRGWLYSPHRGPYSRTNRFLISLARHLSGIPAPTSGSQSNSRTTSPHRESREEELVEKEAKIIERRGRQEANIASRGGYSEGPGSYNDSRSASPESIEPHPGDFPRPLTDSSLEVPTGISKRTSWNQPSDMTPEELAIANAYLISRLKPFLTDPSVNIGLTLFFYNDETSQSRSTTTNELGHFSFRAALDFVPTNVRVLASPSLSTVEEIRIIEPKGISLISDVDDTIKHSAIGGGAKEMFRNTFIRELKDLTVEGVQEWYNKMTEMSVEIHYCSNSPWQLYPLLCSFFAGAGLPKGTFHLKQYSGMLQGIFEPVAERKKGTLDKILQDFPERRFILVGDSGEADLELYTDIAIANPGRILAIFIRDVTTTASRSPRPLFDPSSQKLGDKHSTSKPSPLESRPILPPRRPTIAAPEKVTEEISLIDLEDKPEPQRNGTSSLESEWNTSKPPPPRRPSKPLALRSTSSVHKATAAPKSPPMDMVPSTRKSPPPPPKPRKSVASGSTATPTDDEGYKAAVRHTFASAYNAMPAMPSAASLWNHNSPSSTQSTPADSRRATAESEFISQANQAPPPVPARRNITHHIYTPHRTTHPPSSNNLEAPRSARTTGTISPTEYASPTVPLNKKEELWKRRWARATDMLHNEGVYLKSWRVGSDVFDDAIRIVERAKREENFGGKTLPRWKSTGAAEFRHVH